MNPVAGLLDELIECTHAHRQGHGHQGRPSDPHGLDGGDQGSSGGAEQGNVVPRLHTPGLKASRCGPGLHMQVGPRDCLVLIAGDEGDRPPGILGDVLYSIDQ